MIFYLYKVKVDLQYLIQRINASFEIFVLQDL